MVKKIFKPETIQSMADDLVSLPQTRAAKDVGKIQAIRQLEPAIRTARENGYTWDQIVQRLNEQHGLNTTVTAVRNYLGPRYEARGKGKAPDKIALTPPARSINGSLGANQTTLGGFRIRPDSDKI